jgi:hypothetical protein
VKEKALVILKVMIAGEQEVGLSMVQMPLVVGLE